MDNKILEIFIPGPAGRLEAKYYNQVIGSVCRKDAKKGDRVSIYMPMLPEAAIRIRRFL